MKRLYRKDRPPTGRPTGRPVIPHAGPDGEKQCTKCGRVLPLSSFRRKGSKTTALHPRCRDCLTEISREWWAARPEEAARKALRQTAYKMCLDRDVVSTYVDNHDGRCDICGGPPGPNRKRLDIEHDHDGGEFRGMTCNDCNNIMKFADDDIVRLRKVIAYLIDPPARSHPGKPSPASGTPRTRLRRGTCPMCGRSIAGGYLPQPGEPMLRLWRHTPSGRKARGAVREQLCPGTGQAVPPDEEASARAEAA